MIRLQLLLLVWIFFKSLNKREDERALVERKNFTIEIALEFLSSPSNIWAPLTKCKIHIVHCVALALFRTKSSRWTVTKSHLIMISSIKNTTTISNGIVGVLHPLHSAAFYFNSPSPVLCASCFLPNLILCIRVHDFCYIFFGHHSRSLHLIFILWFSFSSFAPHFLHLLRIFILSWALLVFTSFLLLLFSQLFGRFQHPGSIGTTYLNTFREKLQFLGLLPNSASIHGCVKVAPI